MRASILEITPLGASYDEVQKSIRDKIRPNTFYHYKRRMISDLWPAGSLPPGKVVGGGVGLSAPLKDMSVYWAFDHNDRLADVRVVEGDESP